MTTNTALEFQKLTMSDTGLVNFVFEEIRAAKWRIGLKDIECYIEFSNPGIYVAKLDGVPIGCVCFTQYSDDYYTFSFYIVNEKYRGKGYGLKMFETIKQKVDWCQNISCYSVSEMVDKYKRFGLQPRFFSNNYFLKLTTVLTKLKTLKLPQDLEAKDPRDVDQDDLLSYDTSVFGYQRHSFILKWIYAEHNHCKVVVNNKGDIVGYVTARTAFNEDVDYIIGPLFADSMEVAFVLLKVLFENLLMKGGCSFETISIKCPIGMNAKIEHFIGVLEGHVYTTTIFLSTKSIPFPSMDRWFAATWLDV